MCWGCLHAWMSSYCARDLSIKGAVAILVPIRAGTDATHMLLALGLGFISVR